MASARRRSRSRGRSVVAAGAVALGLLALSACGGVQQVGPAAAGTAGQGLHGATLDDPYVVPAVTLTDTDGEDYDLVADTERPLTLVFFGFTNCPDVCTVVMSSLASAMTRLDDAQRDDVEVVLVTTDPARDDAATMRSYLDRFDPSFTGLTGDLADIEEAAAAFSVFFEAGDRMPSGGYDVEHGTYVAAVVPDGEGGDEVTTVWDEQTSAAELAADVLTLLREQS